MKQRIQLELLLTIIAMLATLGLVTLPDYTGRMESWEMRHKAQSIQRGAALYEVNCRSCHGVNGEGVSDLGPALNDEHFFSQRLDEIYWTGTLAAYVENAIATGRVVPTVDFYSGDGQVAMNAWSQQYGGPLRPDEIHDLTNFVLNWEATALGEVALAVLEITPTAYAAGDAAAGWQVFRDAGCAGCHAVPGNAVVNGAGPDLTNIATAAAMRQLGQSAEGYLRASVLIPNETIVEGYSENSGCGGVLSYRQLDDLVAFLLTLE